VDPRIARSFMRNKMFFDPPQPLFSMEKILVRKLQPALEQEVIATLIYKGRNLAIRAYIKASECGLEEARRAVDKLASEIEPGQAS
jgi:hypothetical protein